MKLTIFLYSLLAGLGGIIGMSILIISEKWARKNSVKLISLSVGIFLGLIFIHFLPEAIELNHNALWFTLGGFLLFYLLESVMLVHSHADEETTGERHHSFGALAVLGLSLHSAFDGLSIGVGFEVSKELGYLATFGVLTHKIPDGIAIASILFFAKELKKTVINYSTLISLITPAAALFTIIFIQNVSPGTVGALLAFSSGFFTYIAASDLIPQTHRERSFQNFLYIIIGIGIMFLAKRLFEGG